MDTNRDGVVTLDEFIHCCRNDDAISRSLNVFDSSIWPEKTAAATAIETAINPVGVAATHSTGHHHHPKLKSQSVAASIATDIVTSSVHHHQYHLEHAATSTGTHANTGHTNRLHQSRPSDEPQQTHSNTASQLMTTSSCRTTTGSTFNTTSGGGGGGREFCKANGSSAAGTLSEPSLVIVRSWYTAENNNQKYGEGT